MQQDNTTVRNADAMAPFVPCPTCRQYSHSIGTEQLAAAFNHFQTLIAHPVRGHPMDEAFDADTRDAAQVLMAAALSPADGAEDDWLVAQLAAWPTRVDRAKTTNIEYLMKAAARRIRSLTPTETGEQVK